MLEINTIRTGLANITEAAYNKPNVSSGKLLHIVANKQAR